MSTSATLTAAQLERYSRQIQLPQIAQAGQQTLQNSHAVIVGCGGLGCPAAMYLAAAGIGQLTLIDYDMVELSNLQRQIGHHSHDIGQLKTESLRDTCLQLNPETSIHLCSQVIDNDDLGEIIANAHVVLDCSDNFPTRFAVNHVCVAHKIPLVSGAAIRFEAQLVVFRNDQPDAPCYRCLFRDTEAEGEACSRIGVLSPLVGVIGSMQAVEAIKVLLDLGQESTGKLLLYDAITSEWRQLNIPKDPACVECGNNKL